MAMMAYEQCIQTIEGYVKQLEGLAFSKNAALAARLSGAIDATVHVAGVSGDTWNRRVHAAMQSVMQERPSMAKLEGELPEAINVGAAEACKAALKANSAGPVKLPTV